MRVFSIAFGLAWVLAASAAGAAPPPKPHRETACLSSGDAAEAVTMHKVIAPAEALGKARGAVPNADVLRASLCRDPDALVYRITVLRPDGRVVRVTVDAPSGKVRHVH
ncbi:PepSY domain-containing protein [uncultured Enterovirga sp.]|uniref:PepSY domain-containing protein n=1 Tax=uncultured Enterovirga sp. TaxID=2026352 RepID=UPI0035CBE74B